MSLCHFSVQFFRVSCCHDFSVIVFMTCLVPAQLSVSFLWVSAKHFAISHLQISKPSVSFEIPISHHPKPSLQESAHSRTNVSLQPSFTAANFLEKKSRRIRCSFLSAPTPLFHIWTTAPILGQAMLCRLI